MSTWIGFYGKIKEISITLEEFQNFTLLEDFIKVYDKPNDPAFFRDLLEEIEPIAKILIQYTPRQIHHYDDCGYPDDSKLYSHDLDGYDFNPAYACGSYVGSKILRLYFVVQVILNLYEFNKDFSVEIE